MAFVVRSADLNDEKSAYRRRIWLAASDGSGAHPLTAADHSSTAPAFSADGRHIAFLSPRSGEPQIWVMPLPGPLSSPLSTEEPRQITRAPAGVTRFKWAPLPNRLAFVAPDPESPVTRDEHESSPSLRRFGADGVHSHLFTLDVDDTTGSLPVAIQVTWGGFHISDFDWAPSGTRIAAVRLPDPSPGAAFGASDLLVVNLIGRGVRRGVRLTGMSGAETGPRWSPDGAWVAFNGTGDRPEPIGLGDIYIVPAEGGEPKRLAPTRERSGSAPIGWTPDGEAVLVGEPVGTSFHVVAVPIDGSAPRPLTVKEGFRGAFSVSTRAGMLAYSLESTDVPPEAHVLDLRSGEVVRISDLHDHVPRPLMGATEVISWTSADGTPVEGLLTYPPDLSRDRRYPMAVVLHGGPAGGFSQTFSGRPETYMVQSLAQRGFAVLRPNPRGSTGYGEDFRYATAGDWGGGDAADVLSGVDRVVQLGVAHADSVVVMGWNYGGYLASMLTVVSDRFRAASIGAPLTDLLGLAATTDIPDFLTAYMGAEVWDDPAPYRRQSIVPRLGEIDTPTQIFHGPLNQRIPLSQSRALHTPLKERGVDTELILLDGASGGPDHPNQLMAMQAALHGWLEGHLRPVPPPAPLVRSPRQPRETEFILEEYAPYGKPGHGVIEGRAFLVMPDGRRQFCSHETVFMNPVTTFSTEWYERNVIAREELEPIPHTGFHWITRSDAEGRFRFVDLPPGEYYLGCRVLPKEGFAHGRVTVVDGEKVSVELVRWLAQGHFGNLHPEAPLETAHWGQLAGVWSCAVNTPDSEGRVRETTSTWTWEYDLDGRAVRDIYVGHRTDGTEPYHGGAIRIFNPEKSEWEVSWIDSRATGTKWFTATSSEDRVVMKKAEDPEWQTVFYDITDRSFEWLTEPSGGRMSCERSEK